MHFAHHRVRVGVGKGGDLEQFVFLLCFIVTAIFFLSLVTVCANSPRLFPRFQLVKSAALTWKRPSCNVRKVYTRMLKVKTLNFHLLNEVCACMHI